VPALWVRDRPPARLPHPPRPARGGAQDPRDDLFLFPQRDPRPDLTFFQASPFRAGRRSVYYNVHSAKIFRVVGGCCTYCRRNVLFPTVQLSTLNFITWDSTSVMCGHLKKNTSNNFHVTQNPCKRRHETPDVQTWRPHKIFNFGTGFPNGVFLPFLVKRSDQTPPLPHVHVHT